VGLAEEVGHLPLALSHAAAYMHSQDEGCTAYLARYTHTDSRVDELMPADARRCAPSVRCDSLGSG